MNMHKYDHTKGSKAFSNFSVVAKNYRDNIMEKLSKNFPFYDWENNMGYGTKSHINMIKTNGITKHHRKTFKPIASFIHNNS